MARVRDKFLGSAFWRGALLGIGLALPVAIATALTLSKLGLGDPRVGFGAWWKLAVGFAALPAAITAGGVARVSRRAALARPADAAFHAMRAGAIAFAPAGAGLVILCALPVGAVPDEPWRWLWMVLAGAVTGAAVGACIGRFAQGEAEGATAAQAATASDAEAGRETDAQPPAEPERAEEPERASKPQAATEPEIDAGTGERLGSKAEAT